MVEILLISGTRGGVRKLLYGVFCLLMFYYIYLFTYLFRECVCVQASACLCTCASVCLCVPVCVCGGGGGQRTTCSSGYLPFKHVDHKA